MTKLNKGYAVNGFFQKQLKNRSSKDLRWLTGPGTKDIMRCVSGAQLAEWARNNVPGADAEIRRRAKRAEKKASK